MIGSSSQISKLGELESFELDHSATVTINEDCSISKLLRLTGGTLNSNSQDVRLKSNDTHTCLVDHNGGTAQGDYICERFVNTSGHHFLSSPVSDATLTDLSDDFMVNLSGNLINIYYYDELSTDSEDRWIIPGSTSFQLLPGMGITAYFTANSSGRIIDLKGPLNNGNIQRSISLTSSIPALADPNAADSPEGWNLIGNPYMSSLDFDDLVLVKPPSMLSSMYRWDCQSKSYTSYVNSVSSNSSFNSIIPSMQGFWVRGSADETVLFTDAMRITDPEASAATFLKSSDPLMRLALQSPTNSKETVIYFQNGAKDQFEADLDAFYLLADQGSDPEFASVSSSENLSINALPELQNLSTVTIPLYTQINAAGTYTISLDDFSDFPAGAQAVLHDLKLSSSQILNDGSYSFYGDLNDQDDRFLINLLPGTVNTDLIEEEIRWIVYQSNEVLYLGLPSELRESKQMNIYNTLGQHVFSKTLNVGQQFHEVSVPNILANNVYFIEIEGMKNSAKIIWR